MGPKENKLRNTHFEKYHLRHIFKLFLPALSKTHLRSKHAGGGGVTAGMGAAGIGDPGVLPNTLQHTGWPRAGEPGSGAGRGPACCFHSGSELSGQRKCFQPLADSVLWRDPWVPWERGGTPHPQRSQVPTPAASAVHPVSRVLRLRTCRAWSPV